MQSHNQEALQAAVQCKKWHAQEQLRPTLWQALRTAREVYLIFSVNQSGSVCHILKRSLLNSIAAKQFFGYARYGTLLMAFTRYLSSRQTDTSAIKK